VEPIIYLKKYQIIFFAKYKDIPVAVKFSSSVGSELLQEGEILKRINTLGKTCPNIVLNLCIDESITGDEMIGWMVGRRSRFVDDDLDRRIRAQLSVLEKEYGQEQQQEKKRMIKTVYDDKRTIVNQFNNFQRYIDLLMSSYASLDVFVFERIASPYTLNWLIRQNFGTLTLDNFLSISFQLFSFIHGIRQLGLSHEDFTSRNIWLQPILTNYKYLAYPVPAAANYPLDASVSEGKEEKKLEELSSTASPFWYLPLKDSFHFIIKVGDYGEAKSITDEEKGTGSWCNDLFQLSNYLFQMHEKCTGCNDVLMDVVECLKKCRRSTVSSSSSCQYSYDINPFNISAFSDRYSSLPEDWAPENTVTPDLYFDYSIVDQSFINKDHGEEQEQKEGQQQLISETRKRYVRQEEKGGEEKEDETSETAAKRLKTNNNNNNYDDDDDDYYY
jgi:hypothetical protein